MVVDLLDRGIEYSLTPAGVVSGRDARVYLRAIFYVKLLYVPMGPICKSVSPLFCVMINLDSSPLMCGSHKRRYGLIIQCLRFWRLDEPLRTASHPASTRCRLPLFVVFL